jgi:small subunit ribosomal protein S1
VFVDLGGVEGLIHISELSWGRVVHPSQMVQIGQEIEVQVLELAPERCRVALSLKRLQPNPWDSASLEFPEGRLVSATITTVVSYGAFAKLDAGVEGLIHASEMPLAEGQAVKDLLSEGQSVQVRILHVDAAHQRLGLSMKVDS